MMAPPERRVERFRDHPTLSTKNGHRADSGTVATTGPVRLTCLVTSSCVSRTVRTVAAVFGASLALGAPVSIAWGAGSSPTVTTVSVSSTRVFTDAGVVVRPGDLVDVRVGGRVDFGPTPIDRMTPAGIPWGRSCNVLAASVVGWPAHGLACWSLIGRVGAGPPFEIGDARTLRITRGGELFLGVNDNHLGDNSGAWAATVRVTPRTVATVPPTLATTPPQVKSGSQSSSKSKLILAGVAVMAVLAAVVALVARKRRAAARRAAARPADGILDAPEVPVVEAAVPAEVSGDILPEARSHSVVEAPDAVPGGPTDVNIFEVELPDAASLYVGYSYFPANTVVRWLVRQDATARASGEFVTNGGGSVHHFVTIALGAELDANPDIADIADIEFTWAINGVPFGYSVRRGLRN
jgi:hypothetical protein